jgi:hypothetical protein
MIEVEAPPVADTVRVVPAVEASALLEESPKRLLELTGEIVDSKCFLGVMIPGSGKTHKDCASLCLRGGIPPAFYVHDRAGHSSLLLLTGAMGEPVGAPALQAAGEAMSLTGSIQRQRGWLVLRTDPTTWHRLDR